MSSGGSGQQQSTTTQTIPPWLQSAAQNFLGTAGQVAQLPYTPYTGQRVADLSPLQTDALQGFGDLSRGIPSMGSAESMLNDTLQGKYSNPYASQGVSGGGQYHFDPLNPGQNQYGGENPYFQSQIDRGEQDLVNRYKDGTSADLTRLMNMSGVLGGSAHQHALANNEHELGNQLTSYENQMRQGQYDRSAQLAESGLNRGLQAGQFNASLGNQAFESSAQRGLNAGQFNANLGSNAYENERNRQLGAVGASTGLFSARQQGLNNQLNAGNVERNQNQSLLDSQYGDFTDWRNYPNQQLQMFGNALAPIFGGAPRNTTNTTDLPPPDRVSQGLGIASLGSFLGRNSGK